MTKLFDKLPKSDEQLAKAIGISSKTIKRIRKGNYIPSKTTISKIVVYCKELDLDLSCIIDKLQYNKE